MRPFRHLFEHQQVLATRDMVLGREDVYGDCGQSCRHGTAVLSLLAARLPGQLDGAAPDATYILIRTDAAQIERHLEEDHWLAGAEYADSLGAHMISSSLVYRYFDTGEGDYTPADLDGHTAMVSIAAGIAASKGILVVNAVGNLGSQGLSAPADAAEVLSVGAVNAERQPSTFSGKGPTADGRRKPELVALGEDTWVARSTGGLRQGKGTSLACPLVVGLAACLWQAVGTEHRAEEIKDALIRSASHYARPDDQRGYGIPDALAAWQQLSTGSVSPLRMPCQNSLDQRPFRALYGGVFGIPCFCLLPRCPLLDRSPTSVM